jgi:hypothetical protein
MPQVVQAHLRPVDLDDGHPVERFQFSSPSNAPFGEVTAGAPGGRPAIRSVSIGSSRCGIGIDLRPVALFGLPSISFPPTCVIERGARILRAARSTSSTRSPTSPPNRRPV